jgi:hypothetical protein
MLAKTKHKKLWKFYWNPFCCLGRVMDNATVSSRHYARSVGTLPNKGNNNGTVLQGAFKRESPQKQTKLIRSSTIWVFILSVHFSSDFITFFVCVLHKFAYSQIIQDDLEFQILGTIWLLDTCKFSNSKTWPNVKLENNYHIPDLVQAFPKNMVGLTSHLYDSR